jgi:hypothetical protein
VRSFAKAMWFYPKYALDVRILAHFAQTLHTNGC